VPLLTDNVVPFTRQGRIDMAALTVHLQRLMAAGIDGFAPGLSEFLFLDAREKEELLSAVADIAPGRPLLACAWDPSPGRTLHIAEVAAGVGAMGVVVPPPLLHRLPDASYLEWYGALARKLPIPVYAWHDPRLGAVLSPALCKRLIEESGACGWIDGSNDAFRIRRLATAHGARVWAAGDERSDLSGITELGGHISLVANAWPSLAVRMYKHRDASVFDAIAARALAVQRAGGIPAIKRVLGMTGRLPLVGVEEPEFAKLPAAEVR
jgi:4-hydroxy-tetrahydrodipicolinate synthase